MNTYYIKAWEKEMQVWEIACIHSNTLEEAIEKFWLTRERRMYEIYSVCQSMQSKEVRY